MQKSDDRYTDPIYYRTLPLCEEGRIRGCGNDKAGWRYARGVEEAAQEGYPGCAPGRCCEKRVSSTVVGTRGCIEADEADDLCVALIDHRPIGTKVVY